MLTFNDLLLIKYLKSRMYTHPQLYFKIFYLTLLLFIKETSLVKLFGLNVYESIIYSLNIMVIRTYGLNLITSDFSYNMDHLISINA